MTSSPLILPETASHSPAFFAFTSLRRADATRASPLRCAGLDGAVDTTCPGEADRADDGNVGALRQQALLPERHRRETGSRRLAVPRSGQADRTPHCSLAESLAILSPDRLHRRIGR